MAVPTSKSMEVLCDAARGVKKNFSLVHLSVNGTDDQDIDQDQMDSVCAAAELAAARAGQAVQEMDAKALQLSCSVETSGDYGCIEFVAADPPSACTIKFSIYGGAGDIGNFGERVPGESEFWESVQACCTADDALPQDAAAWAAEVAQMGMVVDTTSEYVLSHLHDEDGPNDQERALFEFPNVFRAVLLEVVAREIRQTVAVPVAVTPA